MEETLNYFLTSDFHDMDDASPIQFKILLNKFKNEYRILFSKNESLGHEILKLRGELENVTNLLKEKERKTNIIISSLENKIHMIESNLTKKLTFKERLSGSINRI